MMNHTSSKEVRWLSRVIFSILLIWSAFSIAQQVAMEGVEFGYQRTRALHESIGRSAIVTTRAIRGVGGVALVREAQGADGWAVVAMRYDASANDGQRLAITLTQNNDTSQVIAKPWLWDWELVPLARFVLSDTDSAFSYFGEMAEGTKRTVSNSRPVSYHPALQNTLLGLRLMQLDLFLFLDPFRGFFKDSKGAVILGAGERPTFGNNISPADSAAVQTEKEKIESRASAAMEFLTADCKVNSSSTCKDAGQPFSSYIVGDMISPVTFRVAKGEVAFQDKGVCWDFSRETNPGESPSQGLDGVRLLRPLSEAFCTKVRQDFGGIHPIVYRSARRAMRYAALMRHYKARDPVGFAQFAESMRSVILRPSVSTPTEIAVRRGAITQDDLDRIRRELQRGQK